MTMVGADPDALERAAATLRGAAGDIDNQARDLPVILQAFSWIGRAATRFIDQMTGQHTLDLLATADFLRRAADELTRQAAEQRTASSVGSIGSGSGASAPAKPQVPAQLVAGMREVRHEDGAAQLRWWNGLSDDERATLLETHPGELTALSGLPPGVLRQAQEAWFSQNADGIVVHRETMSGELGGSFKIFKLEAGFEVEQVTYADGSVALSLTLENGGGLTAKVIDALGTAGVGGTLRFDSQAEADEFLAGLKEEIVPTFGESLLIVPGLIAADAAWDAVTYLQQYAGNLESVHTGRGMDVSIDADGIGSVDVGADVSVSVDGPAGDPGAWQVEASASISAEAHAATLGVSGSGEVAAELSFIGDQPQTLSFEYELDTSVSTGVWAGVADVSVGNVAETIAHVEFDLTDEVIAERATAVVDAIKRGDVAGAVRELAGVLDRAQIIVQQNVGVTATGGFDAEVLEGRVTSEETTNEVTLVKPPGGTFYAGRSS